MSTLKADDWVELKTPHFNVVSEASESRTREWAIEFELFRRAMDLVLPVDQASLEPLTLVLFRNEHRLRSFGPVEDGKPAAVAAFFFPNAGRYFIAMSVEGARDDVRELVYPGGVIWHLNAASRPVPLWLRTGLGEVFGTFRLDGNSFVIGANRPRYQRYVRVAKPLPFERLVALEGDDLKFNGSDRDHTDLVYAESWETTQALLFSKDGIGWEAFAKFMSQAPLDENPAQDIEKGLGLGAAELDKRLAAYMNHGEAKTLTKSFDRGGVQDGFLLRRMEAWEVDWALGNVLTGAGQIDEADAHLTRAKLTAPSEAVIRESLAALCVDQKNEDEATRNAHDALERGSRNYYMYYLLGEAARSSVSFGDTDFSEAIDNLVRCLTANPRYLPAYESLAETAPYFPANATRAQEILLAGVGRYPGNFEIQLGCAFVEKQRGDKAKSDAHLDRARAMVKDPGTGLARRFNAAEERLRIAAPAKKDS